MGTSCTICCPCICLLDMFNGKCSNQTSVLYGISQCSVLGPTLFTLFTNDLPTAVKSGNVYMYADDTTLYTTGRTVSEVTSKLNCALNELYEWCLTNLLTPHPQKCEAMTLSRGAMTTPPDSIFMRDNAIKIVKKTKLLGHIIDNKINWSEHMGELKLTYMVS